LQKVSARNIPVVKANFPQHCHSSNPQTSFASSSVLIVTISKSLEFRFLSFIYRITCDIFLGGSKERILVKVKKEGGLSCESEEALVYLLDQYCHFNTRVRILLISLGPVLPPLSTIQLFLPEALQARAANLNTNSLPSVFASFLSFGSSRFTKFP
jgi:hypothetical protein